MSPDAQTPDEAAAREAFRDRLERTWDLLRELDRDENDPELYPNDPERDVSNYVAGLWTTLGRYGDVIRDEVWAALVGPSTERDSLRARLAELWTALELTEGDTHASALAEVARLEALDDENVTLRVQHESRGRLIAEVAAAAGHVSEAPGAGLVEHVAALRTREQAVRDLAERATARAAINRGDGRGKDATAWDLDPAAVLAALGSAAPQEGDNR